MSSAMRTWVSLSLIGFLIMALGYNLGGRLGLFYGFLVTLCLVTYFYFYSDSSIEKLKKVTRIQGQDPWGLYNSLIETRRKIRLPNLNIYVASSHMSGAYVFQKGWQYCHAVLPESLVKKLNREQNKTLITLAAYYMKELDSPRNWLSILIARAIEHIGEILDLFTGKAKLFTRFIFYPVSCTFLSLTVSGQHTIKADNLAASHLGSEKQVAEILWLLEAYARSHMEPQRPTNYVFYIVSPLTFQKRTRYLSTQPGVNRRIEKLIGNYPI
jgi:hypothetical protein